FWNGLPLIVVRMALIKANRLARIQAPNCKSESRWVTADDRCLWLGELCYVQGFGRTFARRQDVGYTLGIDGRKHRRFRLEHELFHSVAGRELGQAGTLKI